MEKYLESLSKHFNDVESFSFKNMLKDRFDAFYKITKLLKENDINFCFIGGSVLAVYNYTRFTEDIDLLIDSKDKNKFEDLIGTYFKPKFPGAIKKVIHNELKIPIDIIFSGEPSNFDYPTPDKISMDHEYNGIGIPVLTLKKMVEIKITSGLYGKCRMSDFGDVQKLIELNHLPYNYITSDDNNVILKYEELWNSIFK